MFSVPTAGGNPPVPLSSSPFGFGSGFGRRQITPDNALVVYQLTPQRFAEIVLLTIPIDGGPTLTLADDDVQNFLISPDGSRVVYKSASLDIYSVPIRGGTATKLGNSSFGEDSEINYQISPNGSRVVYRTDSELFSVPIEGGTPIKLDDNLLNDPNLPYASDFLISSDGAWVVYMTESLDLYSAPIGGGEATQLDGTVAGDDEYVANYHISPDGSRVVYSVHPGTSASGLYSVSIGGGQAIKLSGALAGEGDQIGDYQISPDGGRVVYHAYEDPNTSLATSLYSVSIDGGNAVMLAGPGGEWDYQITAGGQWVVYQYYVPGMVESGELYSVPIGGGAARKLDGPHVSEYRLSPDGERVVYWNAPQAIEVGELFSIPVGGGSATRLNGPLVSGGSVGNVDFSSFDISPDGKRIVYVADQVVDGQDELFATLELAPRAHAPVVVKP